MVLNRVEKLILKQLLQDGKKNPNEIAKALKMNANTVQDYIDRLQEKKIIDGFSVLLEPATFKITEYLELLIKFDFDDAESMITFAESISEEYIKQFPEIQFSAVSNEGLYFIITPLSPANKKSIMEKMHKIPRMKELIETTLTIADHKSKRIFRYFDSIYPNFAKKRISEPKINKSP